MSSSEDIPAKTKSVIELKKLQLLELQSRLRRLVIFILCSKDLPRVMFYFSF